MFRLPQALARIGAGAFALGSLAWVLWPENLLFLSNSEAIFFFFVSIITWVATEFKLSEELQLRTSSPNDIRISKRYLDLHRGDLGHLLRDHNSWDFIELELYGVIDEILDQRRREVLQFQNSHLENKNAAALQSLQSFRRFIAQNTTPELLGGRLMIGIKPISICDDDEYKRRQVLANQANKLSSKAWDDFQNLISTIKRLVPEALD